MSKNVLFISEQTLKDRSLLQDNVDPKLIKPTIKHCQDMFIEPILGTGLYRALQDQITNNNVSVLNAKLLDLYITDCLSWYVASEMVMSLGYKLTNKNVLRKTSENSETSSLNDLFSLMEYYKKKAEWYAQRITDCLSWYVASEMVMSLGYKLTNKNVLRKTSENSETSSLNDLFSLMEYYKNKAEWYAQRTTDYLIEYITDYPLYNNAGSGVDIIQPNGTSFQSSIYLGDSAIVDYKDYEAMYQSEGGQIGKDYRN